VPALPPAVGPLMTLPPGGQAETGITGIEMSPSKPGIGEMKLSKSCIQTIKT
jgi:hypothetical protein